MGVAEDGALFLQVDFEVFGHVQGELKNYFIFKQYKRKYFFSSRFAKNTR